ncbi:MAG: hypothetical protein HFF02_02125 [Erysipelotrichaceae bacterium]|nr:hypothetical protein [Erysipelotrichaceae bacterium]
MRHFYLFCVKSYADKLYDYFDIAISDYLKADFLTLFSNNNTTTPQKLLSKYGEGICEMFNQKANELIRGKQESIAQKVEINLVRINSKANADFTYYATNNPKEQNIQYVDRPVDYNQSHPLTHHKIVNEIDRIIKTNYIDFTPIRKPIPTTKNPNPSIFTTSCFDALAKKYKFKDNNDDCVKIELGNFQSYKYAEKLITYVISLIADDKDVVMKAKK